MTHSKSISGQEIYLKMLEYGNECFACGITFTDIKNRLIADNLYEIGQPEEPLHELFFLSFNDYNTTCVNPKKNEDDCNCEVDDFNHLANCPYYLSKQGCMDFVKLAQSLNNEKAAANNLQAAKDSLLISQSGLRISNISKNLGYLALGLGIIGLVPTYLLIRDQVIDTKTEQRLQQQLYKTDTINKTLLSILSKIDSANYSQKVDVDKNNLSVYKNQNGKVVYQQDTLKNSISFLKKK